MKLKNCPFCGQDATLEELPAHKHFLDFMPDHPGSFVIECSSCSCGLINEDKGKVISHWNSRASGWISINDRLPEDDEPVILYDTNSKQMGFGRLGGSSDVTHWQPFPDEPMEE